MIRVRTFTLLALVAFGLAACMHSALAGAPASSTPTPAPVAGTATAETAPPFDTQFLDAAAVHSQRAVALAQSALTHAQHEELRVFAYEMAADHEAEIRQIAAWRKT